MTLHFADPYKIDPTDKKHQLLPRLYDIGQSLKATRQALALIALGSVGAELDRLDDYSHLCFLVVVEPGQKQAYLAHLNWLDSVCPIEYSFQQTPNGYKALLADGNFCEFSILEPHELGQTPYSGARIVWHDPDFDEALCLGCQPKEPPPANTLEWNLGEALTNLYVGLCRYRRGEKLSAARFVQGYALDRLVEISHLVESEQPAHKDIFTPERRYEQRFPLTAQHLNEFMPGYERTPEAAKAILSFLEAHFEVNAAIKAKVLELCD